MKKLVKASTDDYNKYRDTDDYNRYRDTLITILNVPEQVVDMVENINGTSLETFQDILYVTSGYRTFEQLYEELNDEK